MPKSIGLDTWIKTPFGNWYEWDLHPLQALGTQSSDHPILELGCATGHFRALLDFCSTGHMLPPWPPGLRLTPTSRPAAMPSVTWTLCQDLPCSLISCKLPLSVCNLCVALLAHRGGLINLASWENTNMCEWLLLEMLPCSWQRGILNWQILSSWITKKINCLYEKSI